MEYEVIMKKKLISLVLLLLCLMVLFTPVMYADSKTAISKDGVPISYSVYGEGDTTLVFIHGWNCNSSVWKNQIPYFSKEYRVVTLDLGGYGISGKQRTVYSMEAFGQDVAAVIQRIRAPKVILIGHSMGGAVIIETAKIIPDNIIALVGIDTLRNFEEAYTPQQISKIIKPFKEDFKKAVNSSMKSMFVEGTDPKFVGGIVTMMTRTSPKIGISAMEEMFKVSYVKNPPNIKAPVWCLNSDLWPTKPEINRKYVPEFNLSIMSGVGHFLMLEKPDEFNKKLDEIIKEILVNTKTSK